MRCAPGAAPGCVVWVAPELAEVAADRRREREEKRRGRKEKKKRKKRKEKDPGEKKKRERKKRFSFRVSGFRRSKPDYIAFGLFVKTREVTDLPL